METFAKRFGDEPHRAQYAEMAGRARRSFNRLFWNAGAGCLYDVVNGTNCDGSIRPNQVIALSLTFTMLSRAKAASVLNVAQRILLTP